MSSSAVPKRRSSFDTARQNLRDELSVQTENMSSGFDLLRVRSNAAYDGIKITKHVSETAALETDDDLKHAGSVVVVMGPTGVGKSRFIKEATGLDNIVVADQLTSVTQALQAYHFMFNRSSMALVDTPGFDDTTKPDTLIFRDLAVWLAARYQEKSKLTAVVYIHRIIDPRVSGSTLRNLSVMKRMLGAESFPHLILVTSMWDMCGKSVAENREAELKSNFWSDLINSGASIGRFCGNRTSAHQVLETVTAQSLVRLKIQRELVDQRLPLQHTTAGAFLQHEVGFGATTRQPSHKPGIGDREDLEAAWQVDYKSLWLNPEIKEESAWNGSIYNPLQAGEIRILKLYAGHSDMPVEIELHTTTLAKAPPYAAMSYVVGGLYSRAQIRLRDGNRVFCYTIAENVKQALSYLRVSQNDVYLWIDALCINQYDVVERASQVRRMVEIYRQAMNVCIWLGPWDAESQQVFQPVKKKDALLPHPFKLAKYILQLENLEETIAEATSSKAIASQLMDLAQLMANTWFSRRWCVQEIMVARNATVHSGNFVMMWQDFVDAVELMGSRWREIQNIAKTHKLTNFGQAELIGAISLIHTSHDIFRRDGDGRIIEKLLDLETLLFRLATFQVSVMHDAIYALLELASDVKSTRLRADYTVEVPQLFQQVVESVARSSGSLDIICRPWAPHCGLPSWITTVARLPYQKPRPDSTVYTRHFGDVLVDAPGSRLYRACGKRTARANVSFRNDGAQLVLSARGLEIGAIGDTGHECVDGIIHESWRKIAGWDDVYTAVPEQFWRTLVADRTASGTKAPNWYGRACESTFRQCQNQNFNTDRSFQITNSGNIREFIQRVQSISWSRQLGVLRYSGRNGQTEEQSSPLLWQQQPEMLQGFSSSAAQSTKLCLCPPGTERGDKVCILFGCSVPVVLRQVKSYHILLGECFVHGIMEGEAVSECGQTYPSSVYDIV